jgi:hypothetical protein
MRGVKECGVTVKLAGGLIVRQWGRLFFVTALRMNDHGRMMGMTIGRLILS